MAAPQSSSQDPRAPGVPSQPRRASASAASKLRDSCQACAVSKVKCHKEKPICSRCARRGVTCEYFVTKRPGRKRDNGHTGSDADARDTINVVRQPFPVGESPWLGTAAATAALSGGGNYLAPPDIVPTSPRTGSGSVTEGSSTPDVFSSLFMPTDPSLFMPIDPSLMSSEFGDFMTTPIDLFEPEVLEPENVGRERSDIASLLIPNDANASGFTETTPDDPSNASMSYSPSSSGQALSTNDTCVSGASEPICCCLTQALDLMRQLSPTKSAACVLSYGQGEGTPIGQSSSVSAQTVAMENKQTIEAVNNMLQCSCTEDGYLLTILSMIVFRMLGRYATAARKQPARGAEGDDKQDGAASAKELMLQLGSYLTDGECAGRMAAQLILSELHRMQRLVNQLSPRLKKRRIGGACHSGGSQAKDTEKDGQTLSLLDDETMTTSFSADTLDQIEIDLRKSLSTLSSEIIDMLRRS